MLALKIPGFSFKSKHIKVGLLFSGGGALMFRVCQTASGIFSALPPVRSVSPSMLALAPRSVAAKDDSDASVVDLSHPVSMATPPPRIGRMTRGGGGRGSTRQAKFNFKINDRQQDNKVVVNKQRRHVSALPITRPNYHCQDEE